MKLEKKLVFYDAVGEYGSIGAFYRALRFGAKQLSNYVHGGVKQVDFFSAFYRNMPEMTITQSKDAGFNQVDLLINLITEQGEGESKKDQTIPKTYQNTADDIEPEEDHFEKFNQIRDSKSFPETFPIKKEWEYTEEDEELLHILIEQFTELREALQRLFNGENPDNFFPIMASVGAAIRNCWEHGVVPRYSY
jgi:hypothetical protein